MSFFKLSCLFVMAFVAILECETDGAAASRSKRDLFFERETVYASDPDAKSTANPEQDGLPRQPRCRRGDDAGRFDVCSQEVTGNMGEPSGAKINPGRRILERRPKAKLKKCKGIKLKSIGVEMNVRENPASKLNYWNYFLIDLTSWPSRASYAGTTVFMRLWALDVWAKNDRPPSNEEEVKKVAFEVPAVNDRNSMVVKVELTRSDTLAKHNYAVVVQLVDQFNRAICWRRLTKQVKDFVGENDDYKQVYLARLDKQLPF